MDFRLGIDTGGTYTDAVLVDEGQNIVASSKTLTTRHDLTIGIGNALADLPIECPHQIRLVALSTTLSTNSVVEGRGAPVCVLLPGYLQQQVTKSGLLEIIEPGLVIALQGGHDAMGAEAQELDESFAREMIEKHASQVSAYAVSSMFGVRNPEHELRLRELIMELTDKPVTCGHELASGLNAPRRALTVALNARMVPTIHELIRSMQKIMAEKGIEAPLMMVKGDGSLVNVDTALRQPVGMVLSGPAASVIGACALSGQRNAIIADMGGTTTDIAIVSDGQPELDYDGVRIGNWQPMVEAVKVFSLGLGGDSEVSFSGKNGIEIGPRRVVPISLLAEQYPGILPRLKDQLLASPNPRNNRFALRLEHNEVMLARLDETEIRAWKMLAEHPVELQSLIDTDRNAARALARMQRMGLVIFSGFTPTDAAHVLGYSDHWNREGAEIAAKIWARQMRHVYGLGRWQEGDAVTPCEDVFSRVVLRVGQSLIDAGLNQHDLLDEVQAEGLSGILSELVFNPRVSIDTGEGSSSLFKLNFASNHPVVAVGAPASTWYPQVSEQLQTELVIPENAEVANAYGAVMGSVIQRAHVTITQPKNGTFLLHGKSSPRKFSDLGQAICCAEEIATEEARGLAAAAGAELIETSLQRVDNHVEHDIDGVLFLETRVTATATGRPACA
jgi:N-methylhydantoinase A/oxoprolinase/acetone carboxylase beta subunit